jgi:hypothetical protein
MSTAAVRGTRVGAQASGETGKTAQVEKVQYEYFCANGHTMSPLFAATVAIEDIPEFLDCTNCGQPAGRDPENVPNNAKNEPYKTHLAYVKERRTPEEAEALLNEAVESIQLRRAKAAESANQTVR